MTFNTNSRSHRTSRMEPEQHTSTKGEKRSRRRKRVLTREQGVQTQSAQIPWETPLDESTPTLCDTLFPRHCQGPLDPSWPIGGGRDLYLVPAYTLLCSQYRDSHRDPITTGPNKFAREYLQTAVIATWGDQNADRAESLHEMVTRLDLRARWSFRDECRREERRRNLLETANTTVSQGESGASLFEGIAHLDELDLTASLELQKVLMAWKQVGEREPETAVLAWMHVVEERSVRDLAQEFFLTPSQLRQRVHRFVERVRTHLNLEKTKAA